MRTQQLYNYAASKLFRFEYLGIVSELLDNVLYVGTVPIADIVHKELVYNAYLIRMRPRKYFSTISGMLWTSSLAWLCAVYIQDTITLGYLVSDDGFYNGMMQIQNDPFDELV